MTDGVERPDFFILRTVSSISSSSTSLFSQWLFVPLLGRVIYVYCAHIESKALVDKTSGLCGLLSKAQVCRLIAVLEIPETTVGISIRVFRERSLT